MAQRSFRARALTTKVMPSSVTDKLRLCLLYTNICLGWTRCRIWTYYCVGWPSWCRVYTLINCGITWIAACQAATNPVGCGAGSPVADPGEIAVDPEIYVRQLAELKADLTQALSDLEAHQKEINEITRGT